MLRDAAPEHGQQLRHDVVQVEDLRPDRLAAPEGEQLTRQRRRLAAKAAVLGRELLSRVATIVTPDTLLRWHPELIAKYEAKPGADLPEHNPVMGAMVERMDTSIGRLLDKLERERPEFASAHAGVIRRARAKEHLRLGRSLLRSPCRDFDSRAGLDLADLVSTARLMLRPLLHYFLIGALLLGGKTVYERSQREAPRIRVHVSESASPEELDRAIREAVMLHEARRRGWDRRAWSWSRRGSSA